MTGQKLTIGSECMDSTSEEKREWELVLFSAFKKSRHLVLYSEAFTITSHAV